VEPGIVWAPTARADLARIDDYYAQRDLDFANRTARNAVAASRFLLANPFAGPKVEGTAYRKWHVAESPFLLIYRLERGAIHIVRVRHVREDWQSLA
jgi:plasmid stabilization system protein ParE